VTKRASLGTFGLGGALAAALVLRQAKGNPPPRLEGRWVWPVPSWEGRRAVVSDGWGSPRDGGTRRHLGVDIMYRRRERSELATEFPPDSQDGSRWHFMPPSIPVLAASDGVVTSAGWTRRGNTVVIQHAGGWATYSTHMERLAVAAGQRVTSGQAIGSVGFDPTGTRRLRHLHFELWRDGARSGATDPSPFLAAWERIDLPPTLLARNGAFQYRQVGDRGEPYPAWVRALKGRSGVYAIREKGELVYVGESHSDRLYETLTRHFQAWRRRKGFWKGQFAEGHDPGLTYERSAVEVAVRETAPSAAVFEERRLIQRLRPRDNLLGRPEPSDDDDVPF
jgi:hypothetical protein